MHLPYSAHYRVQQGMIKIACVDLFTRRLKMSTTAIAEEETAVPLSQGLFNEREN